MKTTVSFSDFTKSFHDMGRNDNFTYKGMKVLFDYLEEYEESTDCEIELDVIALCCDYSEMEYKEIADYYDIDISECEDDDEIQETIKEYLEENTMLCGDTGESFVFADF